MRKIRRVFGGLFLALCYLSSSAQLANELDTLPVKILTRVTVTAQQNTRSYLPEVQGTYLYAGKKSEWIDLKTTPADLSNKIGRQVFAKIPGVFVYDMDGAGNQVNIATRGLDPHRGWEFNIRKDGVLTNSDMYGYPASHYSMPLESIERIELVRGTGSLQYGAQFGGMLNYVSKKPDTSKSIHFESINTVGSYQLLSTHQSISGKLGKFSYMAYINRKSRDGYRRNEQTNAEAQHVMITYEPSKQLSLKLEWSRSAYTYRIPGPLTDEQFRVDPQQATRSRNHFNPDIHIPAFVLQWKLSESTKLQFTTSGVLGARNSVLFDKPANVADTINQSTLQYNNRQVDIDQFNSYTAELRVLQDYQIGSLMHTLVGGIQYMNNNLHRRQLGKGTTGSDFDLSLTNPIWGRDIHLKTKNIAVFAENKIRLQPKLLLTAGARVEIGATELSGIITYYPEHKVPLRMEHKYPLFGGGLEYSLSNRQQLYLGWSQSYRPMVFKDLIPSSVYERVDPAIRDSKGSNVEIGFRGSNQIIKWDLSVFLLEVRNRFGTLVQTDNDGSLYTYRTNIGNSLNKGLELFVQADLPLGENKSLSIFTSTAFMNARYTNAVLKSGNGNRNISGNKVESAPDLTSRNGASFKSNGFSLSVLYSYTSQTFADPLNTIEPPVATGAVGLVPAYGLFDLNISWQLHQKVELRTAINNVFNRQYFTKRPLFYPGPGIWPSDGRNISATIAIRL